jgi:hypothetical protein
MWRAKLRSYVFKFLLWYYSTFYTTHHHNTPALGSSFTALFTVTMVVFFFSLRDVIHRHITAAGLRYCYPRKPKLKRWLQRKSESWFNLASHIPTMLMQKQCTYFMTVVSWSLQQIVVWIFSERLSVKRWWRLMFFSSHRVLAGSCGREPDIGSLFLTGRALGTKSFCILEDQ